MACYNTLKIFSGNLCDRTLDENTFLGQPFPILWTLLWFEIQNFPLSHTGGISHTHSKKVIKTPLLEHKLEAEQLAALAVWVVILRFMDDMSEPAIRRSYGTSDNTPGITHWSNTCQQLSEQPSPSVTRRPPAGFKHPEVLVQPCAAVVSNAA